MKNVFVKLSLACLCLFLVGGSAWAQARIGTVDVRKVFDNYWKKKQAEIQLKERQGDIEKESKTMLEDYRKTREEYTTLLKEANDQAVSAEEREKRKKNAEDKFKQLSELEVTIRQFETTARNTIMEQTDRMRANIIADIRNVVSAKAKTAGFTLVIDTAAESLNKTPVVLFSNNENDITDAVLLQLNANAPADVSKEADKAAAEEEKKGKK